jgi:hypothetical protein
VTTSGRGAAPASAPAGTASGDDLPVGQQLELAAWDFLRNVQRRFGFHYEAVRSWIIWNGAFYRCRYGRRQQLNFVQQPFSSKAGHRKYIFQAGGTYFAGRLFFALSSQALADFVLNFAADVYASARVVFRIVYPL